MKTKRKTIVTTVLAAAMAMTLMVPAAFAVKPAGEAVAFTDVTPDDWYYEAVMAMADAGVVNGIGDNKFDPNGKITWAQFATILWRLSLEDESSCALEPGDPWTWGYKAMYLTAVVLRACPEPDAGTSCPIENDALTRAEAANYLWRFFAAQTKNETFPCTYNQDLSNPDTAITLERVVNDLNTTDIPDWSAVKAVCGNRTVKGVRVQVSATAIITAIRAGIINGVDTKNTFDPNGRLTRAQFCQMLYNAGVTGPMYDKYYKGMGIG